jgi:phosphoribosylformylglycinamidine synthase
MTLNFKEEGDVIYLVGEARNDIGCSEYVHKIIGVELSPAPHFDLDEEFVLQQKIATLIEKNLIVSAHDISEGGLFVTLCESGFYKNLGFSMGTGTDYRKDAFLFGEAQSRVVVTVNRDNVSSFQELMKGFVFTELGKVTTGIIEIDGENWGSINYWKELYDTAIEKYLSKKLESEGALSPL